MGVQVIDEITPFLKLVAKKAGQGREILRAGMTEMMSITTRSFNDPSQRAQPWKPLKAATIAEKKRAGKSLAILKRDGLLWRSFRVIKVTDEEATGGSDRPYAAVQQFGTKDKRIPARPMLPFTGPPDAAVIAPFAAIKITAVMQAKLNRMLAR